MPSDGDVVRPLTAVLRRVRAWLDLQVVRFLISGFTCFAIEVGTFAAAVALTDSVIVANTVAVVTAAVLNYTLHVTWVFRTKARPRTTVTRCVLSLAVFYGLSTSGIVLVVWLGVPEVPAKVLVGLALAPVAFLAGRHWLCPGSAPVRSGAVHADPGARDC